jgi:AcrR family transcriptional regulator
MIDPAPPSEPAGAVSVTRGGYAKGDARRELIIAVATEIFGTQGFRAATMLQIALACGISRTGLLHHFPTKESLLEAVLTRRDTGCDPSATSSGMAPGGTTQSSLEDARSRLGRLLAVVGHNATQPRIVNLFSVLSAEAGDPTHPAHDYFAARYTRLRAELEQSFATAAAAGQLATGADPRALAVEIIALMDGLQVQWVLSPSEIDMVAVLRHRLATAVTFPIDTIDPIDSTEQDPSPTKEHG